MALKMNDNCTTAFQQNRTLFDFWILLLAGLWLGCGCPQRRKAAPLGNLFLPLLLGLLFTRTKMCWTASTCSCLWHCAITCSLCILNQWWTTINTTQMLKTWSCTIPGFKNLIFKHWLSTFKDKLLYVHLWIEIKMIYSSSSNIVSLVWLRFPAQVLLDNSGDTTG